MLLWKYSFEVFPVLDFLVIPLHKILQTNIKLFSPLHLFGLVITADSDYFILMGYYFNL